MADRAARARLAVAITASLALGSAACATSRPAARPAPFPGTTATAPSVIARAPGPAGAGIWAPAILDTALSLRGVPYRLGGAQPATGFDCSGFVRYVFAPAVALPRTVAEQFRVGRVVDRNRIAPGDLVFFSTVASGASHVGIAIGRAEFVHAPVSGGFVRIDRIDATYWRTRFVGARRLM